MLMNLIKDKLLELSEFTESIRIFIAIRKTLTTMIPLIIIGSITLMLTSLPIPAYQSFITSALGGYLYSFLNLIVSGTLNMMSIYMVILLSYQLASMFMEDSKELIVVSSGALAGYFVLSGDIASGSISDSFDGSNFFTAILCAILTCYMYKFFRTRFGNFVNYHSINSDSNFFTSIHMILPATTVVLSFALLNFTISSLFHVEGIQGLFSKICIYIFSHLGNSYPAMLLYSVLVQVMWFFGIHGNNILQPAISDLCLNVGEDIFSKSFYDTFVNIGGSGVILSLVLALIFVSKTQDLKYVTKLGFFPALFNISEPISIGIPVLFNIIFFIPFIFVPIISGMIAYFATYVGLVPIVSTSVEWTTPIFFSGYYATGSWAGAVLQLIIVSVGALIYSPFIVIYEEKLAVNAHKQVAELVRYMEECEKNNKTPNLLKLKDSKGQTARALVHDLSDAIDNDEVFFQFQPQTDSNNQCIGCEALVRWNHSLVGYIYPPLLVVLASEAGLLEDIERRLVKNSCELIREIETLTGQSVKVSINLTVASFMRDGFEEMISSALYRYGISASSLCLELTENEVYTSDAVMEEKLHNLQARGHKLIIDDFGMGHTSLKYLQANRFDIVKLDGSLTKGINDNPVNQKIIRSICELGTNLGFDVIAEYVETESQKNVLDNLGCSYYQGYYYSPAITKTEFIKYYTSHNFFVPLT